MSVVVGAYTRPVVRYVLSFLVLCQAAGCGDNTSPTSPTSPTPTPTQVAGNRAERQPPFIGDFEWNTPSIIDASDPSWFRSVTYVGRADRVLWDHVEQGWVTRNVFLFNVQYEGLKWLTEFQVHPDYGSREEARRQVDLYAPVLGRLPQALLSNTKEVEIQNEPTNRVSASANSTGIFHINTFQAADRLRIGLLEETLIHEGGHVSLQGHSRSAGWLAAQQADGVFITNYARDFPFREDVADSIEAYFAVKYRPDRISIEDRNAMLDAIPNRFAYFDGLQLDMSPFVLAVPW